MTKEIAEAKGTDLEGNGTDDIRPGDGDIDRRGCWIIQRQNEDDMLLSSLMFYIQLISFFPVLESPLGFSNITLFQPQS